VPRNDKKNKGKLHGVMIWSVSAAVGVAALIAIAGLHAVYRLRHKADNEKVRSARRERCMHCMLCNVFL
jgi:hypothetical protein